MPTLTIKVTGSTPKRADTFWTEIERAIGALVGDNSGRLTRISRPDGHCDYRDHGRYELMYTSADNSVETWIDLEIA